MRIRLFTLLAVFALVVAACSPSDAVDATNTTASSAATAPEAILLSYALETGDTFTYEMDLDQTIEMTAQGDTENLGGEDIPSQMSVALQGTTTIEQTVADGPEPGTYSITITGDLTDLELTGTMDGQPVTGDDVPDFAGMEPIEVTVVVDEQGNVIPDESSLGGDMLGGLGGFDFMDQLGANAGASPGQFVGPPFSEDEVTVGDTWSETVEVPTMPGQDPISTRVDSEVVATDVIDGNEVFVIDTTTATSAIEFDLAEMLIGFFTAFVPPDASDEDKAQIEAMADELRFAFSIDPQKAILTTWFDYEAGLARKADFTTSTHMVTDIAVPDEETGEVTALAMDMTIGQNITYRLVDADTA